MKKMLIALLMLIASTGMFAQGQPKKDTTKKVAAKTAAGPTKKDGTADMRYKANKDAAKPAPAGPTKKDGTADMRYKANKGSKDTTKKKN